MFFYCPILKMSKIKKYIIKNKQKPRIISLALSIIFQIVSRKFGHSEQYVIFFFGLHSLIEAYLENHLLFDYKTKQNKKTKTQ